MADRRIEDFATVTEAKDDDLLLVSSEGETYNMKFGTFKEAVQGDADRAKAAATAAEASAAAAEAAAKTAQENAVQARVDANAANKLSTAAQKAAADADLMATHAADAAERSAASAATAEQAATEMAQTLENIQDDIFQGMVVDIEQTETGILVKYTDGGTKELAITGGNGGVGFTSWAYDQETKYLHLYGEDGLDVIDPVYIPGGSGGGSAGSNLTFAMQTATSMAVAESATEANVGFIFRSVDSTTQTETGNGTLQIYVGGTLKRTLSVPQGENVINVRDYLSSGSNAVSLSITDGYGNSATRKCTISIETLTLEWSLGNTEKATGALTINLTPYGSYTKKVYILVDDEEYESFEVSTTGRRQTKTIAAQPHGGHIVSAYCTMELNGTLLTSDVLTCAVAWVSDDTTPVIACDSVEDEIAQYSTVNLVHRVIDPQNNPTTVDYLVNGSVYKTEESVDQTEQTWSYRMNTVGEVTLGIRCGDQTYSVTITVTGIGSGIEEVTDGLEVKVEPSAMTSLHNWENNGYSITLSEDFDEVNGGLVNDGDGVRCIRITAGDRLTLNYPLFSGDARKNGLAAKIIYRVKDSSDKETTAISCLSGGVGLEIKANNAYLHGNQTTVKLSTCEDMKAELDFNIQPDSDDRIMHMWEKASTFSYMQYATDENFTQSSAQGITFGSDDADVYLYLFRAYSRDLTVEEIKANFIADGANTAEILERKDRNDIYDNGVIDVNKAATKNPDTHFVVINAERLPRGKKDYVAGNVQHIYKAGGAEHQFTGAAQNVTQGTSSVEHVDTAGGNINMTFTDGITLEDGTVLSGYAMNGSENSIAVDKITYKKNVSSEEHVVNRAAAEWYNRFQPSVRAARVANPKVRDCLESTMCAVFFHNTGASAVQIGPDLVQPDGTIFYGLGNLCSNKDSVEAFAYDPIVIEVRNNTEPQVRFKTDDLSGDNFSNNYEFRYLDTTKYSEDEAKALWQVVQTFVHETDYTAATDAELPAAVTINGVSYTTDSAAYRKARWIAEAPDHFDMDTLYFHHNFTLFYLLRDNRAKNMFWSYNPTTGKWGLWFNWDNDTGLCRNNDGYIDIEPGYMDFDTLGTSDVFNGADSVIWTNLRECNFSELRANYLDRESAGAWDIDAFYAYCMESQEYICESLWIEDAQHNAIRTMQNLGTTDYLERATGRLRLHLKKALMFQKVLVDSYYNSTAATTDSSAFRGYTPSEWAGVAPNGLIEVVTYTNMYINILAGSTEYHVRATAGVPVTIDVSASLNNTEMYFRHAPWIQSFGDLSGLYLGQFEASKLTRVRKLLIGSDVEGYYNTNFTKASFENCSKLEELNLGGLTNANRAFDFTPNIYLKKLYSKGSSITGLTFAKNGRLQEAYLNAVASLYMSGLYKLETFEMESYTALDSLTIENCPVLDTYSLVKAAENLSSIRLIGIDWSVPVTAYAVLMALYGINGRDDDNYITEHGVVTGAVYFTSITESRLQELESIFTGVEFSYDPEQVLEEYTVTFCDGDGNVLNTQKVERGGAAVDPITAGYINTPTKASDVEYHYTYWKWDTTFSYIIEDTVITAQFTASDRYYTVTYANRDGSEIESHSVKAHDSCEYTGVDPMFSGYIWYGWDKSADDVVEDMTITAQYIYPTLPSEIRDMTKYDFAYSDNDADSMAYPKAEFAGILLSGLGRTYFAIGDKIKMMPDTSVIVDTEIVYTLHGFDHFKLSDDSGVFAGTTWFPVGVLNATRQMNTSGTNAGGWPATGMRAWLNKTLYPSLPPFWRSLIKRVQVLSSEGGTSPNILRSDDYLYLMSRAEVGFNAGDVPYCDEVDPDAENVTFACYTDNNSRIKKYYNGTGGAVPWWLRSPEASGGSAFAIVGTNGLSNGNGANIANGVAPGFSI